MIRLTLLMFVCLLVVSTGCNGAGNVEDTAKHDMVKLKELVDLSAIEIDTSFVPIWEVYPLGNASSRMPGPNDYYLVAAVKIYPVDRAKFTEIEVSHLVLNKRSDYYPVWLPESVKNYNAVALGKKPKIYDVKPFVKSSYRIGHFFITDDNYLYLILSTN